LCTDGTGFYRPDVLPVTHPAELKHGRELGALTPARRNGFILESPPDLSVIEDGCAWKN